MEDPFLYLARSITFQQLAGAAARTIWGRVLDRFAARAEGGALRPAGPGPAVPTPEAMLKMPEKELRSAFSNAGVDALELATSDDLVDAILRFVDLRKRRSQLATGGGFPKHLGAAA